MNSNAFESDREEEEKNELIDSDNGRLKKQKSSRRQPNLEVTEFDVIRSKSGSDFVNRLQFRNSSQGHHASPDNKPFIVTKF